MTNDKILEVCDLYKRKLTELAKTPVSYYHWKSSLAHLVTMLPKIKEFVQADRRDKAFRWLGFIQGVLWVEGIYTIDELKKHNMPEEQS